MIHKRNVLKVVMILIVIAFYFRIFSITKISQIVERKVPQTLRSQQTNLYCLRYNDMERPKSPPKLMEALFDAVDILKEGTGEYSLAFGTLLHMYRNCGLLPDSNDVDLSVPLSRLTSDFLEQFYSRGWKYCRSFGKEGQHGYEVALTHPNGERIDIYGETFEGDFTWQAVWVKRRAFMCAYETPTTWYTLHVGNGVKFQVHGKPEDFFKTIYGMDWKTPKPTKTYNWINPRCIRSEYTF